MPVPGQAEALRSITALDPLPSPCVTALQSRRASRRPTKGATRPVPRGGTTTPTPDQGSIRPSRYRTHGMASIRVVLAEDNALLREGISRIIDGEPDFDLVGPGRRSARTPGADRGGRPPTVVVTDIRMPPTGTDEGIQAASWLREHKPEVGVVVLSQYKTPSYALALLETGSAGRAYLLKEQVAGRRRAGPGHPHGRPGRAP